MNKILKHLVVCILLVGCTTKSIYKSSADNLLRAEYPQPYHGFLKSWKPLGKKFAYELTEKESQQSYLDVEFCIENLYLKYSFPPSETLRVLQIIECMRTKGWHVEVEEILITR